MFVEQACTANLCFAIAAIAKSIKGLTPVTVESYSVVFRLFQAGLLLQLFFVVTKDQSSNAGPMSESAPRTHHLTSFVGRACKAEL